MPVDVRYIPFEEIDTLRWNSCIHYAHNGNVFGYHWFLKNVVREFDALVEGNYESVMPLIKGMNRAGQDVLYHPAMLGRLGIFSVHVLSDARLNAFTNAIPEHYKESTILFNEFNPLSHDSSVKSIPWFRLNLDQPYENIARNYSEKAVAEIEKGKSLSLLPDGNIKPEKLIAFFKKQNKDIDEHAWMRIHYNLMHRGIAFPTTYRDQSGKIFAAALFAYSNGYFVNLFYSGLKNYASPLYHLMMDDLIRVHAGRPLTLDFNRTENAYQNPKDLGAVQRPTYQWVKRSKWGKIVDWMTPW